MLKIYEYNGHTYQYEEGTQPEGAKLVEEPKAKKRTTANKSRKTTTKKGE